MTSLSRFIAVVPIAMAACSPAVLPKQAQAGSETVSVIVHHVDLHPRSGAAARATLGRIGEAAMEACGGSPFSFAEVKMAIRASTCWHDSMADAVARIGDPMLTAEYDQFRRFPG